MKRDWGIGVYRVVQSVGVELRTVFLKKKRLLLRLTVGKIDGVNLKDKELSMTKKCVILKEENGYE